GRARRRAVSLRRRPARGDHDRAREDPGAGARTPRAPPRKIPMTPGLSLLVVGSVALDDIDGPQGRRPDVLGGSASFCAVAASYLCRDIRLVGVVGEDFPQAHVDFFAARGIDLAGLERVAGKTFRWRGRYADTLDTRATLDT